MAIVYANMKLSEVVEEHPSLIPVINRFGIRLGLGDKSVRTLCEEHALDTDFLLTILNTFLNEEYFPEQKLQTFHISQLIDYLTLTNQAYLRYQLPNIERHLGSFIQQSDPGNQSLALLGRFFASFKAELTARRAGVVSLLPPMDSRGDRLAFGRAASGATAVGRRNRAALGRPEEHHGETPHGPIQRQPLLRGILCHL